MDKGVCAVPEEQRNCSWSSIDTQMERQKQAAVEELYPLHFPRDLAFISLAFFHSPVHRCYDQSIIVQESVVDNKGTLFILQLCNQESPLKIVLYFIAMLLNKLPKDN